MLCVSKKISNRIKISLNLRQTEKKNATLKETARFVQTDPAAKDVQCLSVCQQIYISVRQLTYVVAPFFVCEFQLSFFSSSSLFFLGVFFFF